MTVTVSPTRLDVAALRQDFPILRRTVHGKPLVYLDNAATTQKPARVIEAELAYYQAMCANIHRGVHTLSQEATQAYEGARKKIQRFLNAASHQEILFTRGTTESINLVAASFGRGRVGPGDEILITGLEHHSNIVPWQLLCEETGAQLKVVPIDDHGAIHLEDVQKYLGPQTKLVAISHISNALGTINPLKGVIDLAHALGVAVLVDGAQAVAHTSVDVQSLDCDFYAFSGHKLFGPTGIGVLYGKKALLENMPPYQGGGDMILTVTFEKSTFNQLPYKFEAGTPNIAGGIGLGAAIDYVSEVGLARIQAYEQQLLAYATESLSQIAGVRLVGTAPEKASVLSFTIDHIHPHDIGTILDHEGIAIRAGHHCAQPVMDRFGVPATARASFSFYNTPQEVDQLVAGIHRVIEVLG